MDADDLGREEEGRRCGGECQGWGGIAAIEDDVNTKSRRGEGPRRDFCGTGRGWRSGMGFGGEPRNRGMVMWKGLGGGEAPGALLDGREFSFPHVYFVDMCEALHSSMKL